MTTDRVQQRDVLNRPVPLAPDWWLDLGGSEPEYWCYLALIRTGRKLDVDFTFQQSFLGGRRAGGAVVDFWIHAPEMGINVQGNYYHYRTAHQRAHDEMLRVALEAAGFRMSYITEDELRENADYHVRLAIAGLKPDSGARRARG